MPRDCEKKRESGRFLARSGSSGEGGDGLGKKVMTGGSRLSEGKKKEKRRKRGKEVGAGTGFLCWAETSRVGPGWAVILFFLLCFSFLFFYFLICCLN
jgi:hypothetical protein